MDTQPNKEFSFDSPTLEQRPFDVWGFFLRQKWFMVLGAFMGLLFGYLYLIQQPVVFQSTTRILIAKKHLPVDNAEPYRNTLAHAVVIESPKIVVAAFEQARLGRLSSFSNVADPVSAILANLSVEYVEEAQMPKTSSDSDVIDCTYHGPVSSDCPAVLDAIVESYRIFLKETFDSKSEDIVSLITKAKNHLEQQRIAKREAHLAFREKSPLLWEVGERPNIYAERLLAIEKKRSDLQVNQTELRNKIEYLEAEMAREDCDPKVLLLMLGMEAIDPQHRNLQQWQKGYVDPQLQALEMELTLEKMHLGKNHPKIEQLQMKIDVMKKRSTTDDVDDVVEDESVQQKEPIELLTLYLQSIRQLHRLVEQHLSRLNESFEIERSEVKKLVNFEVKDRQFRDDIDQSKRLVEAIVKNLNELDLTKNYGGYITQVLRKPQNGSKVDIHFLRSISMFAILGLAAGILLAYIVEQAQKGFHSPDEIQCHLNVPVVGHIPVIVDATRKKKLAKSSLDPILCTFHQPESPAAEAYRGVRTSLFFSNQDESGPKVIQVTSPSRGDGKSTLSSNLGISIAKSGKRVILLDADLRRPRIHKLFSLKRKVGLSSLMDGRGDIQDAIQCTPVENLWALPAGASLPNPSELLLAPRFREIIDNLRENYDFVIVDTSPLLSVSDASTVATHVDAILLTLRLSKNTQVTASVAMERLSRLGTTVLGVVVNGVGKQSYYGVADSVYRYGYKYYDYSDYYSYAQEYARDVTGDPDPKTEVETSSKWSNG